MYKRCCATALPRLTRSCGVFYASTPEGKAQVAKATLGSCSFDESKVLQGSHMWCFVRVPMSMISYLEIILAEKVTGWSICHLRDCSRSTSRAIFFNIHRYELRDATHWTDKQVYPALGTLLLSVSKLGIDACSLEDFNANALR